MEQEIEKICAAYIGNVNSFVDGSGRNHFMPMVRELADFVTKAKIEELSSIVEQSKILTHVDAHISQKELAKDILVHSCSLLVYRIDELNKEVI